jgi:hypothetical protein
VGVHVCEQFELVTRRRVLGGLVAVMLAPALTRGQAGMPSEVAGVKLPQSGIARAALNFSRSHCPDYLLNHCMRTFLFGAVAMQSAQHSYDAETAFAAAALHDLGLLPAFATAKSSFEIDGANRAEQLMTESGLSPRDADIVWHAIALHDARFSITRRQGPEAMLVAMGAGCDVDGPDASAIDARQTQEIVAAFPRLQFKRRFTALAVDHCKRKPLSQEGTWLEGLCREQVPSAWNETVEREIADAPFSE